MKNKLYISILSILMLAFAVSSLSIAEETQSVSPITIENNDEFAALLLLKDPFDSSVKEFADKYDGQTIEFDGNIAYLSNHGSYKTRYDILLGVGEYSETEMIGPQFQYSDVAMHDLHFIGDNVPDSIGIGDNLHIVAEVVEYKEASGLFVLKPVLTEIKK